MTKFNELKIRLVMQAENVPRARALELIAVRCGKSRTGKGVKRPKRLGGYLIDENKGFISAEEFFGD